MNINVSVAISLTDPVQSIVVNIKFAEFIQFDK